MKPAAVFCLGVCPGLVAGATVAAPVGPRASRPPDEYRAAAACLAGLMSHPPPDPARVLDAQHANETFGRAAIDAAACRDDQCAAFLGPRLAAARAERDRALEALRPTKGP